MRTAALSTCLLPMCRKAVVRPETDHIWHMRGYCSRQCYRDGRSRTRKQKKQEHAGVRKCCDECKFTRKKGVEYCRTVQRHTGPNWQPRGAAARIKDTEQTRKATRARQSRESHARTKIRAEERPLRAYLRQVSDVVPASALKRQRLGEADIGASVQQRPGQVAGPPTLASPTTRTAQQPNGADPNKTALANASPKALTPVDPQALPFVAKMGKQVGEPAHDQASFVAGLRRRNLVLYDVPDNGECMYNAILVQLVDHALRPRTARRLKADVQMLVNYLQSVCVPCVLNCRVCCAICE